jgi:hypothetical protein
VPLPAYADAQGVEPFQCNQGLFSVGGGERASAGYPIVRARVVHMVKMSRKTILKYLGAPPDQIGAELAAFTEAVKMAEIALGARRMVARR